MADAPNPAIPQTRPADVREEIARTLFLSLCPYAHLENLDAIWADWNSGGYRRTAERMADRLIASPLASLTAETTALREQIAAVTGEREELRARLVRALTDRNALAAFARDVLDGAYDSDEGEAIQSAGTGHGLLVEVAFDPKRHTDDTGASKPGDPFYELTDLCAPVRLPALNPEHSHADR